VEEVKYENKCRDLLRLALDEAVREYVKKTMPTKGNYLVHYDEERKAYGVVIVGEKFQLQNMRNGQWYSNWTCDGISGQVMGSIKVMVHYFEDGNVQLSSQRATSFEQITVLCENDEDRQAFASELVEKIKNKEDEVQLAMNEAYGQLAETTFKKLRRQLPVTRSKIDWAKLSTYKVGDQLGAAGQY